MGDGRVSSPASGNTSRSPPASRLPFRLSSGLVGAISVTRSKYETTEPTSSAYGPLVVSAVTGLADRASTAPPNRRRNAPRPRRPAVGGSALTRVERLLTALAAHPHGCARLADNSPRLIGAAGPTAERLRATALLAGLTVEPTATRLEPRPTAAPMGDPRRPRPSTSSTLSSPRSKPWRRDTGETVGFVEYDPATATAVMAAVAWGSTPLKYGLGTGVGDPAVRRRRRQSHPGVLRPRGRRPAADRRAQPQHRPQPRRTPPPTRRRSDKEAGPPATANASPTPSESPHPSSPTATSADPSPSPSRATVPPTSTSPRSRRRSPTQPVPSPIPCRFGEACQSGPALRWCHAATPRSWTGRPGPPGMWIDTRGAAPVSALTCAASANFSNGSRGMPRVENTSNRVPKFRTPTTELRFRTCPERPVNC